MTTDPVTLARYAVQRDGAEPDHNLTLAEADRLDLARVLIELTAELEAGEASDGYHTHNELYEYRTLYHAHATRAWILDGVEVTKSWRHADGELCFGGGWFIVTAQLPTGQVTNHYPERDWPLFDVPEVERAAEWDGHTPQEAASRIRAALNEEGGQ